MYYILGARVFSNVFLSISVNLGQKIKKYYLPITTLLLWTNLYKCVYIVDETEIGVLLEGFALVL